MSGQKYFAGFSVHSKKIIFETDTVEKSLCSNAGDAGMTQTDTNIILVTGGAGFIGSHLVEELVKKGHKVHVFDSLVKGKLSSIQYLIDEGKVEFIEGDIRNKDAVDEAMKGVDYVFHTAGIHIEKSVKSPDDCISTNI